jgi:phage shock protein PspC (stress-responsive transcriptional regulator)
MTSVKKTLYRLPKKGKISGVCAGLAEYFDLDVTLVRAIFIIMAFASAGFMIVLYIALSIILPVDYSEIDDSIGEKASRLGRDLSNSRVIEHTRNYLGIGLIILGIWLLLDQLLPQWFDLRWEYIWPILVILAGFLIIIRKRE